MRWIVLASVRFFFCKSPPHRLHPRRGPKILSTPHQKFREKKTLPGAQFDPYADTPNPKLSKNKASSQNHEDSAKRSSQATRGGSSPDWIVYTYTVLVDFTFLSLIVVLFTNIMEVIQIWQAYVDISRATRQWRSHWGGKGGRVPPLTAKNAKNRGGEMGKRGKSGRKGKNREVSFTLPLLTDKAGYATATRVKRTFPILCLIPMPKVYVCLIIPPPFGILPPFSHTPYK